LRLTPLFASAEQAAFAALAAKPPFSHTFAYVPDPNKGNVTDPTIATPTQGEMQALINEIKASVDSR